MVSEQKLSRQSWVAAATIAMAESGIGGIAVEPLAKKLGATKGSFYWHFRDRDELVMATLETWEASSTEAVIDTLRPVTDGRDRLRLLLEALFLPDSGSRSRPVSLSADARRKQLDTSIALNADHSNEAVVKVISRVTERRVAYVADELVALGITPAEARHRALLAYTSYLGYASLARSAPDSIPDARKAKRFVDTLLRLLLT